MIPRAVVRELILPCIDEVATLKAQIAELEQKVADAKALGDARVRYAVECLAESTDDEWFCVECDATLVDSDGLSYQDGRASSHDRLCGTCADAFWFCKQCHAANLKSRDKCVCGCDDPI